MLVETMQAMVPESLGFSPPYNKSVPITANLRVSMLVKTMQEMGPKSLGFSPPYNKSVPVKANLRVSMLVEMIRRWCLSPWALHLLTTRVFLSQLT
jgi:hypothetical protein